MAGRDSSREELGRFDTLICGDVLEHLVDPWAGAARFAGLLEPGGHAVVSLPNMRYWDTFRQLGLRGASRGGLRHLRPHPPALVHTADARELIEQAGLELEEVSPQYA